MNRSARAEVFWIGGSQAVRLPKGFGFLSGTSVVVRREGDAVVIEPTGDRAERYANPFADIVVEVVTPDAAAPDVRDDFE